MFHYMSSDTFEIVSLLYTDLNLALLVVLPKERDGIRAVEQWFTASNYFSLLRQLNRRHVHVQLPRFQARSKLGLREELKEIGSNLFSDTADFSRTSDQSIKFDDLIHEAYIKV